MVNVKKLAMMDTILILMGPFILASNVIQAVNYAYKREQIIVSNATP